MVGEGLDDGEKFLPRGGVRQVGVGAEPEAGDHGVADTGPVSVVDIETAACGITGWEGESQQPLLSARGGDKTRYVEKRGCGDSAVADEPDGPSLLDHEQPAAAVASVGYGHRSDEAPGKPGQR